MANDVPGPSARASLYGCLVPDAPAGGLEMITTGTDSAGNHLFAGASSKRWFTPWGQNYGGPKPPPTHAGFRMLEESLVDNWSGLVAGLRQQRQMGSTVVRILLDFDYVVGPPSSGHPDGTPRAENVAHIVRFAGLARQIGMYVDVTGMCECRPQNKPGWYDGRMSDAERWAAQRVFWSAVARALKDEPSIMVLNLANEPIVAATPPAEWAGGDYGGYSYAQVITRSGIADRAARAAKAVTWANQLVDAIRQAGDAMHLITVGNLPGNLGYGGFYPSTVAGSNLSYLSVHEYPSSGHAANAIADVQSFSHGKPVVVEETFLFADAPTEDAFIRGSAPAAAGWIGQWNSWSIAEIPPEDTYGIWHAWGQLSMRLAATISPLATIAN